jgi:G3E family GTPase
VARQAAFASLLVVNKSDLSDPSDRSNVDTALRRTNPSARLEWTTQAALERTVWQEELVRPLVLRPLDGTREGNSFEGYYSWDWEAPGPLDRGRLSSFLSNLPDWCERVKGVLPLKDGAWVLVQVTGKQARLHPWHEEPSLKPGLSFIGRALITHHPSLITQLEECL